MMRFDTGSLRATILSMEGTLQDQRRAKRLVVAAAGAVLLTRIRENASVTDHTLGDLRRLGHPYARRHGSIQVHTGGDKMKITRPTSRVHRQSGLLLSALRGKFNAGRPSYTVKADTTLAPHAAYVIQGTRIMLGRDLLLDTANAPGVRREMMQVVVKVLGKALRLKAVLRFASAPRPGGT